jgi:hypothetical protein
MNYALLIGTKNGKREIVDDGKPVEIRRKFKDMTAKDGFDTVVVLDKHQQPRKENNFPLPINPTPKGSSIIGATLFLS